MEILHANRHVLREGKITNLRILSNVHCKFLKAMWVWRSFTKPDIKDIASIHYREKGLFKLDALRERHICIGGNMCAICVIDRQVSCFRDMLQCFRNIAFYNWLCAFPVFLVQDIRYRKPLGCCFGWSSCKRYLHAELLCELLCIELHLEHGSDSKPSPIFAFMYLLSGMVLDHLVNSNDTYRIDKPLCIHSDLPVGHCEWVLWPLGHKRHPSICDHDIHPLLLHLEKLNALVHHVLQFPEQRFVILLCFVGCARAVEGHYLPCTHREMLSVPEKQLVLELAVLIVR